MNKRTFLFGLGVGIIIGAALLQLMLIGEQQVDSPDPLNQQEDTSSDAKMYSQEELVKAVSDERQRVEAEAKQTAAEKPDSKATDDKATDTKGDKDAEAKDASEVKEDVNKQTSSSDSSGAANSSTAPDPKRIVLRIPPNTSVADTAVILASHGVITDKNAFIDLMRTKKIRAGYFAFKGKLSLHQVGTTLTSKPLDPNAAKREMDAAAGKN
ncbi:hypothetical protein [Paenibacillus sp. OV219]|uniref:hypothetical protein n=1 Tax=Paenibacillus sp. OV219 TaxID=1884377 RepID=UPI0008D6B428|nr:hypothetical protein [Paenibacillus sp. OV219]SEN33124.1 hypothetical protein SAMN05518847_102693 [Paenibacillus sp. OV219]